MYEMKHNAFDVVDMFEDEVANYTGAPFAIAVDSCTNALFLCCSYYEVKKVSIPSKTYLSVPQSIMTAGGTVVFDTSRNNWSGRYQLKPYPIYDAAKQFTCNMYLPGTMMCLSFHAKKHIPIGKGGMILTDSKEAAMFLKRVRYEGRGRKPYREDDVMFLGWNMYMTPEQAARGLTLMMSLPRHNDDMYEDYRDLREFDLFKDCMVI